MRKFLPLLIIVSLFSGSWISCRMNKEAQKSTAKLLQKGRIEEDTSYIYSLPYESGRSHLVVQGYYSAYTHRNRVAIDFKMKKGTKICAARGGVVVRMNETGSRGGLKSKYRREANYIVIQHDDGTRAGYWHLKKDGVLVNVGDTVKQGQVIGLSGNTGYTAFPHLHFVVWGNDANGQWQTIPTRFSTSKKTRYLRPLRRYKREL